MRGYVSINTWKHTESNGHPCIDPSEIDTITWEHKTTLWWRMLAIDSGLKTQYSIQTILNCISSYSLNPLKPQIFSKCQENKQWTKSSRWLSFRMTISSFSTKGRDMPLKADRTTKRIFSLCWLAATKDPQSTSCTDLIFPAAESSCLRRAQKPLDWFNQLLLVETPFINSI